MNVPTVPRPITSLRRWRLRALLAALTVAGVMAGTAGTASATNVMWPTLGGTHDQTVSCDLYNHQITITAFAAPMWYHHAGQVVKAEVYLRNTRVTTWQTFGAYFAVDKVMPTFLGSAILGSSGDETDWQYPMSALPTLTFNTSAGQSYQVYVNYTYYNDARQVMVTDMHATSQYTSGHWGVSGRVWIPTSSTGSCMT